MAPPRRQLTQRGCVCVHGHDGWIGNGRGRWRCGICRRDKPWRRPADVLYDNALRRARDANLPFALRRSDLTIPERCPVLDIPLTPGRGGLHDGSPSLDRIHPDDGYVPGNVVVISHRANTIKHNATSAEVLRVARWMQEQGL